MIQTTPGYISQYYTNLLLLSFKKTSEPLVAHPGGEPDDGEAD